MGESRAVEQNGEGTAQTLMALPELSQDGSQVFRECLDEVLRAAGLSVAPGADPSDGGRWGHDVRRALREAFRRGEGFPEAAFDALLKAAVYDPNPSFNR